MVMEFVLYAETHILLTPLLMFVAKLQKATIRLVVVQGILHAVNKLTCLMNIVALQITIGISKK